MVMPKCAASDGARSCSCSLLIVAPANSIRPVMEDNLATIYYETRHDRSGGIKFAEDAPFTPHGVQSRITKVDIAQLSFAHYHVGPLTCVCDKCPVTFVSSAHGPASLHLTCTPSRNTLGNLTLMPRPHRRRASKPSLVQFQLNTQKVGDCNKCSQTNHFRREPAAPISYTRSPAPTNRARKRPWISRRTRPATGPSSRSQSACSSSPGVS